MNRVLFALLAILFSVFLTACTSSEEKIQQKRERINFDQNWKFALGHAADTEKDFHFGTDLLFAKSSRTHLSAVNPTFDDSGWRDVTLPHDWAVELPFVEHADFNVMAHGYKPVGGHFPETSIGWYRKSFTIPAADSGNVFSLTFDGIFRDAMIWLNGFYLGNNESGYIGDTYPISDYINFDRENVLVVRVDATQYEGWFYEGAGLYRHVWLNRTPSIFIDDESLFIKTKDRRPKTEIRQKKKDLRSKVIVDVPVVNAGGGDIYVRVVSEVRDRSGGLVAEKKSKRVLVGAKAGEPVVVKNEVVVEDARVWSLEDPYLYRVVNRLIVDGKEVDQTTTRFGIRSIRIDPEKGLFLNGEHIKIKGTNNHQDHAGVGSALPDYLQYYRIQQLKNFGVNAYRASHNPPTPELLDACDSLGMLVMDETRMMNSSEEYMDQFKRLILRDRNHPSVFMWSIGNEEQNIQTTSNGKRIALSMMQLLEQLDPTRTCTYAADLENVFTGINEVIPVRGFNYRHTFREAYHLDHPEQPIVGTEMGSTVTTRGIYAMDSVNCYLPDQDLNAPWWASLAEDWWPGTAVNDWDLGGFIWTGFDYRGEPTPFHWPNISSHFGILDVCGFPKNLAYYYKSWWSDEDVIHISPHWNWTGKEGEPIDVWVNSNADEVELFLNGKSLGAKKMERNSHLKWQVPYEPGKLDAVGKRDGRTFRTNVETSGKAVNVSAMVHKTTMVADGRDATVINIRLVDNKGKTIPTANDLVTFSVTGDARIIGVGNGDPSSHEPDQCKPGEWQRHLFNGYCQVILQAGTTTGAVTFTAKSEGLWPEEIGIHLVSPDSVRVYDPVSFDPEEAALKENTKMIGADISFLPQLEARGIKFSENGVEGDPMAIMKGHGFNWIRLRLFNNPENEQGYAPGEGWCDLGNTLLMAKRIKENGMQFLLDFHYSDTWADPGKQFKPKSWEGLEFNALRDALEQYTQRVVAALAEQGTPPDMVQIGNEINHGMVWPDGHIWHPGQLAELFKAGVAGVMAVDSSIQIMAHLALGGQHDETVFWLDQMLSRGVEFDVLGLSFYPRWHGELADLKNNITKLIDLYPFPINIVEYSHLKQETNDLAFSEFKERVNGTFIWEPLSTWESIFTWEGQSKENILIYDQFAKANQNTR